METIGWAGPKSPVLACWSKETVRRDLRQYVAQDEVAV